MTTIPFDLHPGLYRVAWLASLMALLANVLLPWVVFDANSFQKIIAAGSGFAAAVLVVTSFVPAVIRWREEAFLLAVAVWVANSIEFATFDGPQWDSKLRQILIYMSFAVLALGTYLAQSLERKDTD